ncbi:MAG: hypothetical protein ABFS35_24270 [Bacteroidota bacterium]
MGKIIAVFILTFVLISCATPGDKVTLDNGESDFNTTGRSLVLGKRINFSNKKFSMKSPPTNWEISKRSGPKLIISWRNKSSRSEMGIQVFEGKMFLLTDSLIKKTNEFFIEIMKSHILSQNKNFTLIGTETKEIKVNDTSFHRIILDVKFSDVGISVRMKMVLTWWVIEGDICTIWLVSPLRVYKEDLFTIEQMLRSIVFLK